MRSFCMLNTFQSISQSADSLMPIIISVSSPTDHGPVSVDDDDFDYDAENDMTMEDDMQTQLEDDEVQVEQQQLQQEPPAETHPEEPKPRRPMNLRSSWGGKKKALGNSKSVSASDILSMKKANTATTAAAAVKKPVAAPAPAHGKPEKTEKRSMLSRVFGVARSEVRLRGG